MSQDPWNDWSTAWQASPSPSNADLDAIEQRIRRRLFWRGAQIVLDVAACVLALLASLWILARGDAMAISVGAAGLAFSLFSLFVVLANRRAKGAVADRSVISALDREIAEIGADIRRSLGGLAMAAGGLVFLGFCMVVFTRAHVLTRDRWWLPAAGLAFIVGAALWSGWLLVRRRARLRRLTAVRDELSV